MPDKVLTLGQVMGRIAEASTGAAEGCACCKSRDEELESHEALRAQLTEVRHRREETVAMCSLLQRERDAALAQVKALREALIQPFYRATGPDSPQWWSCRVCSYTWKHGEDERHEAHCPFATALVKEATNG